MKLSFRSLAILSALVFFALALVWMFAPNILLSSWDVAFSYPVGLMSRRTAALYLNRRIQIIEVKPRILRIKR